MSADRRREALNQRADHDLTRSNDQVRTLDQREEPQREAIPPNSDSRPKRTKPRKTNPIPGQTPEAIALAVPEVTMKGLTAKQQLFVREYLIDLNATQAAIRAGYLEKCASEIGYENLRKPQIMAAIDSAFMELGGITRSRIVDELGAIAFSDISNIVNWDDKFLDHQPGDVAMIDGEEIEAGKGGITRIVRSKVRMLPSATIDPSISRAIASVSQTAKGSLKVKLHDKIAALDKLARALGMYSETSRAAKDGPPLTAVTIYSGRPDNLPALGERAAEIGDAPGDDGD
jgi:phage terminase small subunit